MSITANFAQTFYIDPALVRNSSIAYITSVDLFFSSKPTRGNTTSGLPAPGVTVFITSTNSIDGENVPMLSSSFAKSRVEYDQINIAANSSTATKFSFAHPACINTGTMYAVVIKYDGDDAGYTIAKNISSGTTSSTSTSISKGVIDGKFFELTNGYVPTPLHDTDLKINIRVAKFTVPIKTYRAVNRNFEFLTYNTSSAVGNFKSGELVFANTTPPGAQTIGVSATSPVITGTATTFQSTFANGSYIVITSGDSNEIRRIRSVSSDTSLTLDTLPSITNTAAQYRVSPVARVFDYRPDSNSMILIASTANSTIHFSNTGPSASVRGTTTNASLTITELRDFPVHKVNHQFSYYEPPSTKVNVNLSLANSSYRPANGSLIEYNQDKELNDYNAYIFSRSNEVQNLATLDNGKSANFSITLITDNQYSSPRLHEQMMNMFAYKYNINANTSNESKQYGGAAVKYISKNIILAEGQDAEDIRVYLTAFRPQNTDISVYVKVLNGLDSESIDSKNWSYLELVTPRTLLSNASNPRDFIELEYKFPNFPMYDPIARTSGELHEARFQGQNASNILTGSTSTVNTHPTANIQPNDVVRIYDPALPNESLVTVVTASSTTTITIDTILSSSNDLHDNFITTSPSLRLEKIDSTVKNSAFNNYTNYGIVRYLNNNLGAHDTYKVFAFKIVMTSNNDLFIPSVDNIRGIALTA